MDTSGSVAGESERGMKVMRLRTHGAILPLPIHLYSVCQSYYSVIGAVTVLGILL